jgi:hypothetical protein
MNYKSQPFAPTSRYYNLPLAQSQPWPAGMTFVYVSRRFLPSPTEFATLTQYTVSQGDRLDNLTANFLGDAEQFWRICDANNAVVPEDLLAKPGRVLRVTLPQGIAGPPGA